MVVFNCQTIIDFRELVGMKIKVIVTTVVLSAALSGTLPGNDYNEIRSIAFSPDGKSIAFLAGTSDFMLSDNLGKTHRVVSHDTTMTGCVTFSKGGSIVTGLSDGRIIFRKPSGSIIKTIKDPQGGECDGVIRISFSRGGALTATATPQSVCLWNKKNSLVCRFPAGGKTIADAALSPDGDCVAMVIEPDVFTVHDARGKLINSYSGIGTSVRKVCYVSDGKAIVISTGDGRLMVRNSDGSSFREIIAGTGEIHDIKAGPGNSILVAAAGEVRLFNLEGKLLRNFKVRHGHDSVMGGAFSPDGKYLAAGTYSGKLYVWKSDGSLLRVVSIFRQTDE